MFDGSKWLLIGALVVATLAVGACRGESQPPPPQHKAEPAAKPTAPVALRADTLDREGIILAALHATTSAALGRDDREAQRELNGRKFAVRIRFGCPGMKDPDRGWTYDAEKQVIRVKVQSMLTEESLPASDLLRSGYEGAAGFIVGKPWLLTAGCPVGGFASVGANEPTIVIAQLFTQADSRVQRPQHSYELTKPLKREEQPGDGLDLVLSGRLAELPDGRSIHCAAQDGPPACIISATIDRVAIEMPTTGDVLGEWGAGATAQ